MTICGAWKPPHIPEPLNRPLGSLCRFALVVVDTVSESPTRASRDSQSPVEALTGSQKPPLSRLCCLRKFCRAGNRITAADRSVESVSSELDKDLQTLNQKAKRDVRFRHRQDQIR